MRQGNHCSPSKGIPKMKLQASGPSGPQSLQSQIRPWPKKATLDQPLRRCSQATNRALANPAGPRPSTTNGLQYPMVELFTGGMILPLMFVNAAATCYLLSFSATAGVHGGMEESA